MAEESVVDIKIVNGRLVVSPVAEAEITLDKLLAGVDECNLHGDLSTGPVGEAEER